MTFRMMMYGGGINQQVPLEMRVLNQAFALYTDANLAT